jgi:proteasome lid subunit RPN8/RPN11
MALKGLGGTPPSGHIAPLLETLSKARTKADVLAYLVALETMEVAAYYDAAKNFEATKLLQTGAQIMANEGQHLVVLRQALGRDPAPNAYEIDGMEQYRIQTEIEDAGWELGIIYHSHTRSDAYPSQTDINLAFYPEALYVIVGVAGDDPEVRAFRIVDEKVDEVTFEVG